ncbi:MAG TPA: hypothetical protein VEO54_02875 [Thermoanaerobaculia bacterium]|nr:hypothetical protein [Thermoanaerobaculia bacterium]
MTVQYEKAFSAWLDRALSRSVPRPVAAFVLNLYEGVDTFDAEIAGAARLDRGHREVLSEERFSIPRRFVDDFRTEALLLYEEWFSSYLTRRDRAPILAGAEGIAVGFADGNLILVHPRMPLEAVHAVFDYYDGVRGGVADFQGRPHAFRRELDEQSHDWSNFYRLKPLAEEELRTVMADWSIWTRWLTAYRAGRTGADTHPALPEDRPAHEQIADAVAAAMSVDENSRVVWGKFHGRVPPDGELEVQWNEVLS